MKKYISIITVIFATVVFAGCKKGYLDQEVNPNAPSVSTPSLTLSAALANSAAIVNGGDYAMYGIWGGYWTTSGSYVPSTSLNEFQFTNSSFDGTTSGPWYDLYSNLTNYNTLKKISTGSSNANFLAIATIMTAYDFEQLVDNYNDVPYSQAFQPSTILFPAYDKGEDIYNDLGKQLDAAIALIAANPKASNPGSADVVFGGNMTGWVKFANTLKLRLAVRVYQKFSSDPLVTDLASTSADGYLDGTIDAEANPGYSNTLSGSGAFQASPFWAAYGPTNTGNPSFGNVYYKCNEYAAQMYGNNNDPRDSAMYTTVNGVVIGNVFGNTTTTLSGANTSSIGPGLLKSATMNAVLLSGAESLFLQAEAVNAGILNTGAAASDLYNAGITASFVAVNLTAAQATAYYSQTFNNVNWASSSNKELAIITQKWLALNGYGNLEAYNEYRRTGYPVLPQSIDPSAISKTLPTRIFYPLSELQSNSTNLAKEGTINAFTSKIFWAK
jgi:hypothetical protein